MISACSYSYEHNDMHAHTYMSCCVIYEYVAFNIRVHSTHAHYIRENYFSVKRRVIEIFIYKLQEINIYYPVKYI